MMRSVFMVLTSALLACGCATVSMQPAEVTTSLAPEQSELRTASAAFCESANERGWASAINPLAFFRTAVFADAAPQGAVPETYAARINADTGSVEAAAGRISRDAGLAVAELSSVNEKASQLVADDQPSSRGDLAGFEKALVFAKKARVSFVEALEVIEGRSGVTFPSASSAIVRFESEIDELRRLANALLDQWQDRDDTVS